MTPKELAKEIYESYTLSYGTNQHWEAKNYVLKVLHIYALANDISYKEYCEIIKEIEKI